MQWDIFLSYASEDKAAIAAPLAAALVRQGLQVWFDEVILSAGDRIRESIDSAVAQSRLAVVVLSQSYVRKNWTRYEFDGIAQRFVGRQVKVVPIWLDLTHDQVAAFSPSLADVRALRASEGVEKIALEIARVARPDRQIVSLAGLEKTSDLRQMFRAAYRWSAGVEQNCTDALRSFAVKNPDFVFSDKPPVQNHEWGRGGTRRSECSLVGVDGNTYLKVEFLDEWGTYSDDSEDYELPSEVQVSSALPALRGLIAEIVGIVSRASFLDGAG